MGVCEGVGTAAPPLVVWYLPSPWALTVCDSLLGIVSLVLPGCEALTPQGGCWELRVSLTAAG